MIFTGCQTVPVSSEVTSSEEVVSEVTYSEVSSEDASAEVSSEEVSSEPESSEETSSVEEEYEGPVADGYEGFITVDGKKLIDENGKEYYIKGMAFGNSVFINPKSPSIYHHSEADFKNLADLGFNSVRFYLNYGLFEDDSTPYEYREVGFEWFDKNIKWAKEYGIRLVLNMHYPQGGYQSGGNGHALWTDGENVKRLTALWTEIAKRYADEPTILGYGLINEPGIPVENKNDAMPIYQAAVQGMVDSIRTVDKKHIIFVEKLGFIQDPVTLKRSWITLNDRGNWPEVVGDNIVYEFHTYDPFTFTHQKDADNVVYYPNPSKIENSGDAQVLSTINGAKSDPNLTEWQELATEPVFCTEENQIIRFNIVTSYIGVGGKVYIDNISLKEFDADGNFVQTLHNPSYNEKTTVYFWSATPNKLTGYSKTEGVDGTSCIWVGDIDKYGDGASASFLGKPDHNYVASVSVKLENTAPNVTVYPRIAIYSSSGIQVADKAYLEEVFASKIAFSEQHNVPIYCGEFGANNHCFSSGGEVWVSDMLDILMDNGIHFNYHAYHEPLFGLYRSSNSLPGDVNQKLYDVFVEKLK